MPTPRSCWHVFFALWAWNTVPLVAAPAQPPKASPAASRSGMQAQYKKALAYFRAGRMREAAQAFASILRSYPDHEPSRIYLGKSYFRLEMMDDAYQQFRTLNPRNLDPETSYEYARAFYEKEQYEEALNTFLQVPEGHGLNDLASYYGAIAALKLKRYKEAEALMAKAVVLPSRLVRTRNLYRSHIQQLMLKEEEEYLSREKAAEEKRLREQTRVFREKLAEDNETKTATPPPVSSSAQHDGFYTLTKGAKAGFIIKRQLVDYSRIATNDQALHTNFFRFDNGFYRAPQKRDRKPEAAWGLGLGFGVEDRNYNGIESIIDPTPDEVMRTVVFTEGSAANQKIASGSAQLWYEKAVGPQVWSGLKLAGLGLYPEFKSGKSRMNRSLEWFIGKRTEWAQYRLVLDGVQSADAHGKTYLVTQEQHIEGTWTVPSGFGLMMAVRAQQLAYPSANFREGPERTGRLKAQVFSDFPIGVRVGFEGRMQSNQDYRTAVLPDLEFNQDDVSFLAFIHVKPLDWLDIHVFGAREQRRTKDIVQRSGAPVASDVRAYMVRERHYDFISENGVSISANLLF